MKKTIKLETLYAFQKGDKPKILQKPPSKSFLALARIALTEQLGKRMKDAFCQKHFTECLDVQINWDRNWFSRHSGSILPLLLEPKSDAYILLEFCLAWENRSPGCTEIPYPWLDYSKDDLNFRLIADPFDIKKMNEEISEVVTPVIRKQETGLPYDYQIKTHDGTMKIVFINPVTDAERKAVRRVLNRFYTEYNNTHEHKINFVDEPHKQSEKHLCFNVDFGGASAEAVVEMIYSFRSIEGIRRIVLL